MKIHKIKSHIKEQVVLAVSLSVIGITGCKKFVEVDAPITNPTAASLYTSDAKAASVMSGIYTKMSGTANFAQGTQSITLFAGLNADELKAYSSSGASYVDKYKNSASAAYAGVWKELFQHIYVTNAVLEGIAKSTGGITDSVKNQLNGEAKFMRAFLYFYTTNLYGNTPLLLETDYRKTQVARRAVTQQVYDQIVADLKDAQGLLKTGYVTPTGAVATERVRPNQFAATALLARAYLYLGRWAEAEAEASKVIANTQYKLVTDPNLAFQKTSTEAIWQLQGTQSTVNTSEGNMFLRLPTSAPSASEPSSLDSVLVRLFETGDKRKTAWVDSVNVNISGVPTKFYFPRKYDIKTMAAGTAYTEYLTVLRFAEVLLIRAEARAQQDKVGDAQTDLNTIRTRAGLGNTAAATKEELLVAIEKERQIELMVEWGHRWFDLKRTGRADAVMSVVTPTKGGTWTTDMALWPVPANEIILNPNLLPQNPGYN